MVKSVQRDELILYATPLGAFGDQCHEYWTALADRDLATTAQTFPPHCTLTGFFHRDPADVDRIVDEMGDVLASRTGPRSVLSASLQVIDDWVGFVLDAPDFDEVIDGFVARHRVESGDDPLRPKTWLHLSLAYGPGLDAQHHCVASSMFKGSAPEGWAVGVWRRRNQKWHSLGP